MLMVVKHLLFMRLPLLLQLKPFITDHDPASNDLIPQVLIFLSSPTQAECLMKHNSE